MRDAKPFAAIPNLIAVENEHGMELIVDRGGIFTFRLVLSLAIIVGVPLLTWLKPSVVPMLTAMPVMALGLTTLDVGTKRSLEPLVVTAATRIQIGPARLVVDGLAFDAERLEGVIVLKAKLRNNASHRVAIVTSERVIEVGVCETFEDARVIARKLEAVLGLPVEAHRSAGPALYLTTGRRALRGHAFILFMMIAAGALPAAAMAWGERAIIALGVLYVAANVAGLHWLARTPRPEARKILATAIEEARRSLTS